MTPGARRSGAAAPTPADGVLSALVVVRAASGRALAGSPPIDAASLPAHQASPADVDAAQRAFAEAGLEAGPYVGISFAITGARSRFERLFDVRIRIDAAGVPEVRRGDRSLGLVLPIDRLPHALRPLLETVTFSPPVELFDSTPMI